MHLEESTTSEVRVCGRNGTSYSLPRSSGASEGRSGCERISPDPLGYGATQQIGRNLTLIYPTLGLGPGHVPQRSDIFFSHGRDLAGFEPRTFRFQGFPEGRSGRERISPDPLGYGATASRAEDRAEDPGFESRLRRDFFGGRVIPVTSKLALQWQPCQAPGVIGSVLGLVGPVSVYRDRVR